MKCLYISVLLSLALCSAAYAQDSNMTETFFNKVEYTRKPIKCFSCSTHPTEDNSNECNDEFDKDPFTMVECPAGICLKYYQNVEGDIEQINRGCAEELEPTLIEKEKEEGCVLSTGTKQVQVKICNCVTEGCNGVGETKSASAVVMAAGLLCLLAKLMY